MWRTALLFLGAAQVLGADSRCDSLSLPGVPSRNPVRPKSPSHEFRIRYNQPGAT